jgi:hypothetical protein
MAKATPEEQKDLGTLLQQIRIVPAKDSSGKIILDPQTGNSILRVMAVEKGSVYDREGVRVGDLISGGTSYQSGTTMELTNTKKSKTNTETTNQ